VKKSLSLPLAALSVLLPLTACSDSGADDASDGRVNVVASTDVWGDVAATVGGDDVAVTSIISDANQDPHGYEASTDELLLVEDADVVLYNGGGYDEFMVQMLDTVQTDAPVIDAFEVSGLEQAAPAGAEVNEHVWYDVDTVAAVADQVAAALGDADPDNAATYTANAEELQASLAELGDREQELAGSLEGTPYALTEPLPVYLADALGMQDRTPEEFSEAVEEGEDVPVAVTQETLDLVEQGQVDLLFYNEQTTSPVTDEVRAAAEDAGVPVVAVSELLPEGTDYVTWIGGYLDDIQSVLGV
jgi:zinc/manganese transport system substrate-binding protein